ncbi:anti-sigma factor family protein [Phycicoccus avicenniae]|uniref:anti-sigma factor family protein n=1 Tax=Phycicoccus avicenniae TaxID=2828860 RepID=UPI003D2D950C
MSGDPFVHDDAAYVLGALGPVERRAFEEHLAGCADCTRRVRDIAGLPGLLATLDASAFTGPDAPPPVPDTLLPALLRRVHRRRRRVRLLLGGAVAAAVALAVALAWSIVSPSPAPAPLAAAPTPTSSMAQVDQDGLTATVGLEQVAWGTKLRIACAYRPGAWGSTDVAPSYALVVRTRDGASQQVSTWRAVPGKQTRLEAGTSATPAQIEAVDVVLTGTDRPLLTWQPAS